MGQGEFDFFDLITLPGFIFGMIANLEIGQSGNLEIPLLGIKLGEVLFTIGQSTDITLAFVLTVATFLIMLGTNDWGLWGTGGLQLWATIATIIFIFSPPAIPIVSEVLLGPDVTSVFALLMSIGGYVSISFLG
jgi:hypothetical protein